MIFVSQLRILTEANGRKKLPFPNCRIKKRRSRTNERPRPLLLMVSIIYQPSLHRRGMQISPVSGERIL
jgi:hypothetical protein